jgi:hypothetical protein
MHNPTRRNHHEETARCNCFVFRIYCCVPGLRGRRGRGGAAVPPVLVSLTDFQPASVVIGQPTFTTGLSNQGATAGANTISAPYGNARIVNGKLYVPDYSNRRVLGFNAVPTVNDVSADFVLGQPDMVTTVSGTAPNMMNGPQTVKSYGGKFFVDDYSNSRILIWNTAPTTTAALADIVVGQLGFVSTVTSCTQTGTKYPESIEVVGGKLIVADSNNNRVLIWNSIPTTNGEPADVVLGQGDFTHCKANDDLQGGPTTTTARTLNYPSGVWSNGTRLVVADASNNRVLIWHGIPTTNFAPADVVLGQDAFTRSVANDDLQSGTTSTVPSARTLSFPYFLDSNGTQLFVADNSNNRVLIWNSIPTTNFKPADKVLGQGDFIHGVYNDDLQTGATSTVPTARTMRNPRGVYVHGSKLFVTDGGNSRYLIFD